MIIKDSVKFWECLKLLYSQRVIFWSNALFYIYIQLDKRRDKVKVSDVSPSALHHCRVEDMWSWLCEPRGSSQTAPCVAAASQGPNSGARLRPPHWETNPRRSVGTSCLTGPMTLRGETPVWVTYSPVTHLPSDGWMTVHMKRRQLRLQMRAVLISAPVGSGASDRFSVAFV